MRTPLAVATGVLLVAGVVAGLTVAGGSAPTTQLQPITVPAPVGTSSTVTLPPEPAVPTTAAPAPAAPTAAEPPRDPNGYVAPPPAVTDDDDDDGPDDDDDDG